ncbi:flagellar biosynthesis repressor FlbT [Phreatobacter stygius]|uniref:Flagellar biosynthesis repressor FlbT n=1 Tax=Phreatobacter stygius TaxID=1940610 RepID=A0A4D7APV2_9HYPH|nr:flagellar biosynthesis repressor FlbT [Phreatobacter stygius]QCI63019.1 flagellar biosynthesis repressor FlbT [Phreatobacter stygius]
MALKVELKAGEKFILGDSVITNDDQRTRLTIEGEAPILREKDVMTMETADTPCKKIYLVVQLMYLSRDPIKHHEMYFEMVNDVLEAAPSTRPYITEINNHILTGSLYKALKATKGLIEYEGALLGHASRSSGVRVDG